MSKPSTAKLSNKLELAEATIEYLSKELKRKTLECQSLEVAMEVLDAAAAGKVAELESEVERLKENINLNSTHKND